MENHQGSIGVKFDGMPPITLQSLKSRPNSTMLERLSFATRRRRFRLRESWSLELSNVEYDPNLNGVVEIPVTDDAGKPIIFDGASIPMPWLVSLLTIGILRPLGVVLLGSIVHDYAYRYGHLRIDSGNQGIKRVGLERATADRLLKDIISTINGLPVVGFIAWLFVRIGWLWVKYNGKRWTGSPPLSAFLILLAVTFILIGLSEIVGWRVLCSIFFAFYVLIYVVSLLLQNKYNIDR